MVLRRQERASLEVAGLLAGQLPLQRNPSLCCKVGYVIGQDLDGILVWSAVGLDQTPGDLLEIG